MDEPFLMKSLIPPLVFFFHLPFPFVLLTKLYFHCGALLTPSSSTSLRWVTTSSEALQVPGRDASCPAGQILVQLVIPYTCPAFFFVLFCHQLCKAWRNRNQRKQRPVRRTWVWMDGWMDGLETAKWPHSLFDIFPIVCLILGYECSLVFLQWSLGCLERGGERGWRKINTTWIFSTGKVVRVDRSLSPTVHPRCGLDQTLHKHISAFRAWLSCTNTVWLYIPV